MRILLAIATLLAAFPQLSYGCSCISDGKPPGEREIRRDMEQIIALNNNVLRLRATSSSVGADVVSYVVVRSWKGKYKKGDTVVAKHGPTVCDTLIRVGEEILVGFDDIEQASFVPEDCPEDFPKTKRRLEDKYLRELSRRWVS